MKQPTSRDVTVELDGKTYTAQDSISSGVMTVNSFYDSKATPDFFDVKLIPVH